MAKISSFIICDTIVNLMTPQGDSVPQLVSPQPVLRPPFIPGSFSFGISIGVIDVEFQEVNTIKVIIVSPKGEETYNSGEINLESIPQDELLPKEYQGFILSIDVRNMIIDQDGVYSVEIFVNNESVGRREIPVFRKGDIR